MEKRKWLWKRKSSERSPCETDSSGSISSFSERLSDDQDTLKVSPMDSSQSPEITSETVASEEDVNDGIKHLTERLSAALVNVSAKDDLVKEHVRVAEEAVAGWEKAEEEVAAMKKQLEAVTQQSSRLEDQVSHLDGALKECVRQLRQAREQQEEKIHEAVVKKTQEWESTKSELQNQLLQLKEKEATISKSPAQIDPDLLHKLEYLEQENASLQLELLSQSEELEVRTIERDLSTQAAETASKQHLESIKKVARLEAECRRLKVVACKSSSFNDKKYSAASSIYVESLTDDSQSDSGERFNAMESDTSKICGSESYKCEPSCSDSLALALIAKLDQFKNEKTGHQNLPASAIEIDLMDDFLEMERLAALPENGSVTSQTDPEVTAYRSIDAEGSVRVEIEVVINRVAELEEKVQKMEGEKIEMEEKLEQMKAKKDELEMALTQSQDKNEALQLQLREAQQKLEELQEELSMANESKQQLESQLVSMEAETRTISTKVNLLEAEVEKERILSAEIGAKSQELEEALSRKQLELELEQHSSVNVEPKIKQEDLAVAAIKLAECQKTIASLGKQLSSLATLEDFLIDTASLPEFSSGEPVVPGAKEEPWKLHSNDTFSPRTGSGSSRVDSGSSSSSVDKNEGNTPSSASSSTSPALLTNHVSTEKNRNGFAKFFSRSKNGMQLEI